LINSVLKQRISCWRKYNVANRTANFSWRHNTALRWWNSA